VTILTSLALPGPTRAADSRATFQSSVEMVEIDVAVRDHDGRQVPGLEREDLAVYEDGVPQQLSFFTWDKLPLSLVLLVDTSASMHDRMGLVQNAAAGFLSGLRPDDRAQIRRFTRTASIDRDFTNDVGALRSSLFALQAGGHTALYDALYITLSEQKASPVDERRRRVIVLLTDGLDTSSLMSEDQVMRLAGSTDVAVYSIGVLTPPLETAALRAKFFLTALSKESGGQAYFPAGGADLGKVYASIAEDLGARYCVGYVPNGGTRAAGLWRNISVLTPRRLGLSVRHRSGYYPSASNP
jgi:VWFA-related protein